MFSKNYQAVILKNGLSQEQYDVYTDLLDTCLDHPVKTLYSRFFNQIPLFNTPGQGYGYLIDTHQVILDADYDLYLDKRGQGAGFYHEAAHWIDYEANRRVTGNPGIPYSVEFSGKMLAKTLIREIEALYPIPEGNEAALQELFMPVKQLDPEISHGVSTLIDGVFQGRYTRFLPYGQSSFYWQKDSKWLDRLTRECFAEMMEAHITSERAWAWFDKNLPQTCKVFMELVELMLEDLQDEWEPGFSEVC